VQNTLRNPNSPSSTVRGPAKPSAAKLAASTPAYGAPSTAFIASAAATSINYANEKAWREDHRREPNSLGILRPSKIPSMAGSIFGDRDLAPLIVTSRFLMLSHP
jgi:hypothetical protein